MLLSEEGIGAGAEVIARKRETTTVEIQRSIQKAGQKSAMLSSKSTAATEEPTNALYLQVALSDGRTVHLLDLNRTNTVGEVISRLIKEHKASGKMHNFVLKKGRQKLEETSTFEDVSMFPDQCVLVGLSVPN
ncbi:MAG: hypothetical protein V2I33_20320 [Kangiellaceae bacterium]|nr:hypothetical protein [Kangiellaceae bacterium]